MGDTPPEVTPSGRPVVGLSDARKSPSRHFPAGEFRDGRLRARRRMVGKTLASVAVCGCVQAVGPSQPRLVRSGHLHRTLAYNVSDYVRLVTADGR